MDRWTQREKERERGGKETGAFFSIAFWLIPYTVKDRACE